LAGAAAIVGLRAYLLPRRQGGGEGEGKGKSLVGFVLKTFFLVFFLSLFFFFFLLFPFAFPFVFFFISLSHD